MRPYRRKNDLLLAIGYKLSSPEQDLYSFFRLQGFILSLSKDLLSWACPSVAFGAGGLYSIMIAFYLPLIFCQAVVLDDHIGNTWLIFIGVS